MHELTTATRSGFAEPTTPETRIAALEDHLRNETRSSQALLAENANLKALCKVLGVVPELPPDGEPVFLPLADLRDAEVFHAKQVLGLPEVPLLLRSAPPVEVRWRHDVLKDTGRTRPLGEPFSPIEVTSAPVAWTDGPQPQVYTRTNGKIVVVFASPCGQWAYHFGHTFAEAVALRDHLTAATAKGRDFFEGVHADEQARDASKGAK